MEKENIDQIEKAGNEVDKIKRFEYLGFILQKDNGFEEDMKHWFKYKWKEALGILYDKRIQIKLKGKLYKACNDVQIKILGYRVEQGCLKFLFKIKLCYYIIF